MYRALGCHIRLLNQSTNNTTKNENQSLIESAELVNQSRDKSSATVDQSSKDKADIEELMKPLVKTGGKILNVFIVSRPVEKINFQRKYGNMKLLTHCSPVCNFLGILSRYTILMIRVYFTLFKKVLHKSYLHCTIVLY